MGYQFQERFGVVGEEGVGFFVGKRVSCLGSLDGKPFEYELGDLGDVTILCQ